MIKLKPEYTKQELKRILVKAQVFLANRIIDGPTIVLAKADVKNSGIAVNKLHTTIAVMNRSGVA